MERSLSPTLDAWLHGAGRKPLILRGARQTGKTWLVRDLARRSGKRLIELNFERDPQAKRFFVSNDPATVIGEISLARNQPIEPEHTILFLDEIQAAPDVIAKLRWFAEEMQRWPVVAAGSLLEFTLSDHTFSMPVGRVSFLHLEPMGFAEFLTAHKQDILHERLASWRPGQEFSPTLHEQALIWHHRYGMVGGMPAIVEGDTAGHTPGECREQQRDLLATYRADFAKYRGRIDIGILDATLRSVARSIGKKFVYSHVDEGIRQHQAKHALELLASARVCHIVRHTAANGLPLGGETKDVFRKAILNDVGLLHALIGTPGGAAFPGIESLAPQVRGQLAEQLTGQQLRLLGPFSGDGPELFYWQREAGRPGEIDYVLQFQGRVLPVELKAGSAGSMKSLHQFMFDKHLNFALRFDTNPPSEADLAVRTTQGDAVRYRLLGLPGYLVGFLGSILEGVLPG